MHDCGNLCFFRPEKTEHFRGITNVQVVMLVLGKIALQLFSRPGSGRFCAEKSRAHVIVDSNDTRPLRGEVSNRL